MKSATIVSILAQALAVSAAAIDYSSMKREVENWNSAAWSNFVKVYAVDDSSAAAIKREVDNWNAAAWSNFVKVYAVDDGKTVARSTDETANWNAAAWSNFVKSYVVDDEESK